MRFLIKFYKENNISLQNLHIQINEHKDTNMFIFIIIYFTNVFDDNQIFLFRC